jgi:hypothetical protein
MLASKENISKSLTLCNTFNSVFADSACSNGVFMEHFVVTDHDGNIPKINPTSLKDCISQTSQYKLACYTYAPTAYLTINSGDYTGAIKWCNGSEANYIGTCIGGIGSQAMKDNINSPSAAEKTCSSTPGAYQDDCVSGAIGMYIYFKGSTTGADSICQNDFPHNLSACESAISSTKNQFGI